MKLGVKTYDDKNFIDHFKDKVDFIEVMSFTDKKDVAGVNTVIHCKHSRFNINPADKEKEKSSLDEIREGQKIADFSKANKIIFHPGIIENINCSKEQAMKVFKIIEDSRLIVENLPRMLEGEKLCSTPEETEEFMKKTGKGFCFDINHAISAAFSDGKNPYDYIEKFLKLKPVHIHLGGQTLPDDTTHIALTESNIDLKKVIGILPENSEVCLEVTQDTEKTEEDIKLFRKIWNETH